MVYLKVMILLILFAIALVVTQSWRDRKGEGMTILRGGVQHETSR